MDNAFEILGFVSEALNTKDAFRRLLERSKEFASAHAGAILRRNRKVLESDHGP